MDEQARAFGLSPEVEVLAKADAFRRRSILPCGQTSDCGMRFSALTWAHCGRLVMKFQV